MASFSEIYDLVQSLSKSEKKHVSLMIEALGGKAKLRYKNAFKIISEANEYDEDNLRKKLGVNKGKMNLSEANNNLYEFIKKSVLSLQYSDKNHLHSQLVFIDFLISRNQFKTAYKWMQKLLPQLNEAASPAVQLRAYELLEEINISYQPLYDVNYLAQFVEDYELSVQYVTEHFELYKLSKNFFSYYRSTGAPRTAEQLAVYNKFYENPILQKADADYNPKNFKNLFWLRAACMYVLRKAEIIDYLKDKIEILRKMGSGQRYYNAETGLYDILITCFAEQEPIDFKNVQFIKKRIESLENQTYYKQKLSSLRCKVLVLELTYFINSKKYDEGLAHFKNSLKEEEKEKWHGSVMHFVVYTLAAGLYFNIGDYSSCIDMLNIVNENKKLQANDFQIHLIFLSLICHYMLKNHSVVESQIQSLRRFLLKKEKLYAPEKLLLKFIKNANNPNKTEEMRKLQAGFIKMKNDPLHHPFFQGVDYISWLDATIKKQ